MWSQSNDQGIGDSEAKYISCENNSMECRSQSRGRTNASLEASNTVNSHQKKMDYPEWINQRLPEEQNYTSRQTNKRSKNRIRGKKRRDVNMPLEDVDNGYSYDENKDNCDKICGTCNCIISEMSTENSEPFLISLEEIVEDDSRRNRRSDHNTGNRKQNSNCRQLASPKPKTSYNYNSHNYDDAGNTCERQQEQQEQELEREDQYQNNSRNNQCSRKLSGLGDMSHVNRNQTGYYEVPLPDVACVNEDRLSPKWEKRWKQQEDQNKRTSWNQQQCGQRLSGLGDVPYWDKNQTENYEMSCPDVSQPMEDELNPVLEERWLEQEDRYRNNYQNKQSTRRSSGTCTNGPYAAENQMENPVVEAPLWPDVTIQAEDYRRIESKLATVEQERLHLLRCIERYQKAWLTETRCKLDDLERQLDVRRQRGQKADVPVLELENELPEPTYERYELAPQPQSQPHPQPQSQSQSQPQPQPQLQQHCPNRRGQQKPWTAPSRLTNQPPLRREQLSSRQPQPSSSLADFFTNATEESYEEQQRQNVGVNRRAPPPQLDSYAVNRPQLDDTCRPDTDQPAPPPVCKFECTCSQAGALQGQTSRDNPSNVSRLSNPVRSRSGMDCNNSAVEHGKPPVSPDAVEFYEYYCSSVNGMSPPAHRLQMLRSKCGNGSNHRS